MIAVFAQGLSKFVRVKDFGRETNPWTTYLLKRGASKMPPQPLICQLQ